MSHPPEHGTAAPQLPVAATDISADAFADTMLVEPESADDFDQAPEAEEAADTPDTPDLFAPLGLAPELLAAVRELGFTQPTAVQQRAIPLALAAPEGEEGFNDLMVSSQTGSGKTAAFLLPVLHTLIAMQREAAEAEKAAWQAKVDAALAAGEPPPKKPRRKSPLDPRHFKPAVPGALVLCPTRELAQQVAQDAIDLVKHCRGLRIANVVGGMPYQVQVARLQNANLVVATPGRLLDLQRSGQIRLDGVRFLVMDEADRMLDLGFADDLAEVHQLTAGRQQTMMFSATFAPRIQQLAMRVMHDGDTRVHKIEIATPQQRHANITQSLYWADTPAHKRDLLEHWLRDASIDQAIVFACTQIECEQLAEELQQSGFAAVSLHGALSQALRNRRLKALRDGRVQILVATDVAARGIDVPTITHVINYGLPMKAEDYTHRIGRTGRAGREGLAITLAEFRDRKRLAEIEVHTHQPFRVHTIAGLEPHKPFPPITQAPPARRGKPGRAGGNWRERDNSRGPRLIGGGFKQEKGRDRPWGKDSQFKKNSNFHPAERSDRRDPRERFEGRDRFESRDRFDKRERFEQRDRFERSEGFNRQDRRDNRQGQWENRAPRAPREYAAAGAPRKPAHGIRAAHPGQAHAAKPYAAKPYAPKPQGAKPHAAARPSGAGRPYKAPKH